MKVLRLVFATLALGLAGTSTVQAHDSFSIGVNIGGFPYYAPPPVVNYYPAQPVVYYHQPVYYAPPVYYYPQASFNYYSYGGRGWGRGDDRWGRRGHRDRGRHGDRDWR